MNINDIIQKVLDEADRRETSAGFAGVMSDHGAGRLREQVEFYKCGINKEVPPQWHKYIIENDPEYKEYLRLKEKFRHYE